MALDGLLDVAEGARISDLERARKGPADPTGKSLRLALDRVRDIHGVGVDAERVRALVPARRLVELARYGLQAKAPHLRRHPPARRAATLVATVCHLHAASIDDCLELFDLIMTTELLGKAERETAKKRAREHPRLARASVKLAAAVGKLLEVFSSIETMRIEDVWREIEAVASREELRAAVETVDELVPHLDEDDEGEVRTRLSERIRMVSGFLRELCEVIELGSNAEGERVLAGDATDAVVARSPPQAQGLRHRRGPGARLLAAAGVRRAGGGGRDSRSQRVRVLRADPVPSASQAPRRLRARIVAVA